MSTPQQDDEAATSTVTAAPHPEKHDAGAKSGAGSSTTPTAKDLAARQDFSEKQHLIHMVLRRTAESIEKHANNTMDEATLKAFGTYISYYGKLLHTHHDHEEDLIFPTVKAWVANTDKAAEVDQMVTKLSGEHDELRQNLNELKTLSETSPFTAESAKAAAELVKKINDFISPHFQFEDDHISLSKLNIGTAREIDAIHAKLQNATKKDPTVMPLFIYSLTNEERASFHFPWFVRRFIFRMIANKEPAVWQFSFNPNKTPAGKYIF